MLLLAMVLWLILSPIIASNREEALLAKYADDVQKAFVSAIIKDKADLTANPEKTTADSNIYGYGSAGSI